MYIIRMCIYNKDKKKIEKNNKLLLKICIPRLLKFTRFIQGNTIASTNLNVIRNIQHLHMNKKSYA